MPQKVAAAELKIWGR